MAYTPQILAFAGSTRGDSFNKKLVRQALEGAKASGAEVTYFDLSVYSLPLYDEDLEAKTGIPEAAKRIRGLMKDHDGFLIAAPEYNSSISGVLKNTIDWVSRQDGDDAMNIAFQGKVVTLMSASPGGLGGMRALRHVREILGNMGCIVLPDQLSVSGAHDAFNPEGDLINTRKQEAVRKLGSGLAEFLAKYYGDVPT